jgi:hypothetical protein
MTSTSPFPAQRDDRRVSLPSFELDDDDTSITSASHATHFLLRTLRCEGDDLDRAIRLYHHSEVVRQLIPALLQEQPAERAAIALREASPSPCVIIDRGGAFITCLGADMQTDLPQLSYAAFAAAMDRADQEQGRSRRRVRQLRDLPISRLSQALREGYGHVTREMVQVLLIDPHTYLLPVFRLCALTMRAMAKVMLTGRTCRLPRDLFVQQHRLESAVRQTLILLGAMEDEVSAQLLKSLLRYDSNLELEIVTSLCRYARGGDILADAALSPDTGGRGRELAAIYIGMHCLYHPENAPAMLRRVRELPQRAAPTQFWTQTREMHDALLTLPDELIEARYRDFQIVARDFRPSTPHWQTTDEDLFDALTLYFPLTALFPAGEAAIEAQRAWARYLRQLPEPRRPRSLNETVKRAGPQIGRNDRCPCGSGRKYKQCCLGKERPAEAAHAPDAAATVADAASEPVLAL